LFPRADGTGLGEEHHFACPAGYYCPTGTGDHLVGIMARDAVNRGLTHIAANPYLNERNVVYTNNDDVRVMSDHDAACLSAIDLDLKMRYSTDWLEEGAGVANPYLLFLVRARPHRKPYTNETSITKPGRMNVFQSWKAGKYYRPETANTATRRDSICGRDHKWRLIDQAIFRKECDCTNFFRVVIALYRFWLCTYSHGLDDLGLGSVKYDNCQGAECTGGRDYWFPRTFPTNQTCSFYNTTADFALAMGDDAASNLQGTVNCLVGAIPFDAAKPLDSIGQMNSFLNNDFLNLNLSQYDKVQFQVNWNEPKTYRKYDDLKFEIEKEYEKEYDDLSNTMNGFTVKHPRTAMDPYVYDLKMAISLIEEFGRGLEQLVWLDPGVDINEEAILVPGRSDMCECERLNKCPNGTISAIGSGSWWDCTATMTEGK